MYLPRRTHMDLHVAVLVASYGWPLLNKGSMHPQQSAWGRCACRYTEEVLGLRDQLVAASLQLHSAVSAYLLPTPAKTHYVFNLRDLSKLFQARAHELPLDT